MPHPPGLEPPIRRPRLGARWQNFAAGAAFTLLVVAAAWTSPPSLQNSDGRVYDIFLRRASHKPASAVPVVVDIDEESLARYGQWPWPRYRVAQLLERVRDLGAAAVALDIVFAEPDRASLPLIAHEIERDLGVIVSVASSSGWNADNDRRLAEVLGNGPFVLGYAFDFGPARPPAACLLHPLKPGAAERAGGTRLIRAPQVVCNLPLLARAAGASGFFNVAPDPDGTVRSVPLLIEYGGDVYPNLALAALIRARGATTVAFDDAGGGTRHLRVAGLTIPVDRRGNMLVRFRGAGHGYDYLPAAAVLEGRVPAGTLSGRIAFVGTTAAGLKVCLASHFTGAFFIGQSNTESGLGRMTGWASAGRTKGPSAQGGSTARAGSSAEHADTTSRKAAITVV